MEERVNTQELEPQYTRGLLLSLVIQAVMAVVVVMMVVKIFRTRERAQHVRPSLDLQPASSIDRRLPTPLNLR